MQTAEHVANKLLLDEITYQPVLEALQKVVDLNGLTSFLLKHGYYLTRSAPSCVSDWRGGQELYGREEASLYPRNKDSAGSL